MVVTCVPSPILKLDYSLVKHPTPMAEPAVEFIAEPIAELTVY